MENGFQKHGKGQNEKASNFGRTITYRDAIRQGPKAGFNFTPEGALWPRAGFEPTMPCGH